MQYFRKRCAIKNEPLKKLIRKTYLHALALENNYINDKKTATREELGEKSICYRVKN